MFGGKSTDVSGHIGETTATESVEENLLGVTLDKNLDFKKHVNVLCKKVGQRLHALARKSSYMDTEKLRIIMNTFIISQFSYCPLVWMFDDRSVNRKINKFYEKAPKIKYRDSCSTFEDLLKKENQFPFTKKNYNCLLWKLLKLIAI